MRTTQVDEVRGGDQAARHRHAHRVGHRMVVDPRDEALEPEQAHARQQQVPGEKAPVDAQAVRHREHGEDRREGEEKALESMRGEKLEAQRGQENDRQRQQGAVQRAHGGRAGAEAVVPTAAALDTLDALGD